MRNKAKYELTESYWKKHARSITHMQQHKNTLGHLRQIFKLKDKMKIHTTRKVAKRRPKGDLWLRQGELFSKHLSNKLDHVQGNTSRLIAGNDNPFENRFKPLYLRKDYLGLLQLLKFVRSDSFSNLEVYMENRV